MLIPPELEELKRALDIRIELSGPSHWVIRNLINDLDEYIIDAIMLILDESIPEGFEYEILEDTTLCDIRSDERDCENTFLVALYIEGTNKVVSYIVFDRIIGDNTYILRHRKIIQP